jgi:hypothetical protein
MFQKKDVMETSLSYHQIKCFLWQLHEIEVSDFISEWQALLSSDFACLGHSVFGDVDSLEALANASRDQIAFTSASSAAER